MVETTEIIRTVKVPLETSDRKNEKLKRGVADFRRAAKTAAEILPSFDPHAWKRTNTQIYRTVRDELDDYDIKSKVVQNAVHRVIENYKSARGLDQSYPKDGIPNCDFVILTSQGFDIEPNDRGYGFKGKFISHDKEWWHMNLSDYHHEYIWRGVHHDASFGQSGLAYNNGNPVARIAVKWDQEITTRADAEYIIGVDIGYRTIYAMAVYRRETGEIVDVEVCPGDAFQAKRARIHARQNRMQYAGTLSEAPVLQDTHRNYTDDRLHKAACEVIDLAAEYQPCIIQLEGLTDYREVEDEPVHNWPFNELQDKIKAKAHRERIGTEVDDAYDTSTTCRKCGYRDVDNREEKQFECGRCGYQVNADVNAAMNIAQLGE